VKGFFFSLADRGESYMLERAANRVYMSLRMLAAQRSTATYIVGWDVHVSQEG
jgi:hypothetical protein